MSLVEATRTLRDRQHLRTEAVPDLLDELLDAKTSDQVRADFLRALTDKGETGEELAAFVQSILPRAVSPGMEGSWGDRPLLDVCGTGGGGLHLFNVSTALMFILPACGVTVVKHGNRGLSKTSGSSDVLTALGVPIDLPPERLPEILDRVGSAFLFAPLYHPSFKILAPVRQALGREGHRTIFNLLGPLLNPARPAAQLMGTFHPPYLPIFEQALHQLKRSRFAVVCGYWHDGQPIGEVSPCGLTQTATNLDGLIGAGQRTPDPSAGPLENLLIDSAKASAARIIAILEGRDKGPAHDLVIENAAWALVIAGAEPNLPAGRARALDAVANGSARDVLERARQM
ncbi:MAG: anthranilate phosphoribosyltransferase [Candidatus Methylacidiphilales bacterium]